MKCAMSAWRYDPGEKRTKHKWAKDYPGFVNQDGCPVGKCPKSMTRYTAESLLNKGVAWSNPNLERSYPNAIFNVHEGVIYKATITEHARSYHGYPWKGRVPRKVFIKLEEIAEANDWNGEFGKWVKRHIQIQ